MKKSTKEIIAELRERKAEGKDISEVSQDIRQEKAAEAETKVSQETRKQKTPVKVRKVKDFIARHKTEDDIRNDSRVVIHEKRNYMMTQAKKNDFTFYNATMFRRGGKLTLLTQKIADQLVADFVNNLTTDSKFTAQDIMGLHKTCGGAYGDKVRKALYKLSYCILKDTEITEELRETVKAKGKQCVFWDELPEARRNRYVFLKIA